MKEFIIAALMMLTSAGVMAGDRLGGYGGIGLSTAYIEYDGIDVNDGAAGISAHGGYRYNEYLAVEGSLGVFDYKDWVWGPIYSAGISVMPMLPISENLDGFLSFDYSVSGSDDYIGNIGDGFGVGIGLMHHFGDMYVRGSIGTTLEEEVTVLGLGVDIGWHF